MSETQFNSQGEDFWGDPPLPEKIDQSDPGISPYKARADHGHSILFSEFVLISLASGWAPYGGGFFAPTIKRVGNLVRLRGLVAGGPLGDSLLSSLSDDYKAVSGDVFSLDGAQGHVKMDIDGSGNLTLRGITNATYVSLRSSWEVE